MTNISLDILDRNGTHKLVVGMLYGSDDNLDELRDVTEIKDFSKVIHLHTEGNPFFAIQYMSYLSSTGLLRTTSDDGRTWEWDLVAVEKQSPPASIADLLAKTIVLLPDKMKTVLTVAAHVGFEFSATLLESMPTRANSHEKPLRSPGKPLPKEEIRRDSSLRSSITNALVSSEIQPVLEAAVEEGLLEKRSDLLYAFPHDQIQ